MPTPHKSTPRWQSIAALPLVARVIDGQLEAAEEQYRLLRLARPGSLDNATVERVVRVYTEEVELLAVYGEQLGRWRSAPLTVDQRLEVQRLADSGVPRHIRCFCGHYYWDPPFWERRQCIDEYRFAHSELPRRLSAVDVPGVEGADHPWPRRVLGDRSRALWAPQALALSSRPLHPHLDPLSELPFLELRPSDGDVVHGFANRRSRVDPGLLQGADPTPAGAQRLKGVGTVNHRPKRPVQLPDDNQVRFAAQCEIEKSAPLAPSPQVVAPALSMNSPRIETPFSPARCCRRGRSWVSGFWSLSWVDTRA